MINNKPKKLAARIYDAIFPRKDTGKRTYAAAQANRLNTGWTTMPTSANQERRVSLSTLIARSRQAARDDLHIVNYLRLMRANVIGQNGLKLQVRAKKAYKGALNVELNQKVEDAWNEWCHAETCTVSGKLDWKAVQDLAVTQCERDGAFLIQMIEAANGWGFALKAWDITWLDPNFSEIRPGGNRVIMSVEVDENFKPVAYWMTMPPGDFEFADPRRQQRIRTRIPAEQMIHGVRNWDDESQVHGVPGTAAALLPAKNAYSYCESVVMASRVAANQFAVLKNTSPDGEAQFTGAENAAGEIQHPFIDSAPLSITPMLPGWELEQFKPEQPTINHPVFKESLDMDIATALGVPYFLLMGNWTAVNFSSSRGGLGEFRERCKSYQSFVAQSLCRRVFHAWLPMAMLSGKLDITPAEALTIQNPDWQPRGFAYVDPTKDVIADVTQLQNKLALPSSILAEQGIDYADFLKQMKADYDLAKEIAGIDLNEIYLPPKQMAPPAADTPAPDNADMPAPDPKKRGFLNGHADVIG